jgi:hypothetical protein
MSQRVKSAETSGSGRRPESVGNEEIENEFLGIWLGLARLREKVRLLMAHDAAAHAPRRPV